MVKTTRRYVFVRLVKNLADDGRNGRDVLHTYLKTGSFYDK
jgi:hypothetical protein